VANVLTNTGFEVDLAAWNKIRNTETFTRDTSEFHGGVASGKVVTPGVQTEEGIDQVVTTTVNSSDPVVAKAWMKGTGSFSLRATTRDPIGLYQDIGAWTPVTLTSSWQQVTATVDATSDAVGVSIELSTGASIAAVTVYLDDLELNTPDIGGGGGGGYRDVTTVRAG